MALSEATLDLLRQDTALMARTCLKIVDKRSAVVQLEPNAAQVKLEAALESQRAAAKPLRAIVLKSRKVGISTWVQAKLIQRAVLNANRRCLVVAQDNDTAGELHDIGWRMYANLPDEVQPGLIGHSRSQGGRKFMHFGEPAKSERHRGRAGLDSTFSIDTAKEVAAGRGKTITDLHCSEVAYWPDPKKALGLLNAVPDEPGTLIVLESTANGHNFFRNRWLRADRGESDYVPVFIGWLEDPDCVRQFPSVEAREEFVETIGEGPWGEHEPDLVEMGATPEQLYWRRQAIVDKAEGKLELFQQEYPSTSDEAFIASGRHVFSTVFIQQAIHHAERFDPKPGQEHVKRPVDEQDRVHVPPLEGVLSPSGHRTRKYLGQEVEIPSGTLWTPRSATGFGHRHPWWKVWEKPQKDGQYIVSLDPASGEDTSDGEQAYKAIQVIDHRTKDQVATYASRLDADLIAEQMFLAGLYWNEALLVVEKTGGYGDSVLSMLLKRFGYRSNRIYRPKPLDRVHVLDGRTPKHGWDTNRKTKPAIEDGMAELLREGTHGIRCRLLALELTTYVKDDRGRSGPDDDAFSDRLMAYMIAQFVARERPLLTKKTPERLEGVQQPRYHLPGYR